MTPSDDQREAAFPTDDELVTELRRLAAHPSTIKQTVPQFYATLADRLAALSSRPALPAGDEGRISVLREQLQAAHGRADKWLDRAQKIVTLLEPEAMTNAYNWAVGMDSNNIPKSMSDWLLDGLPALASRPSSPQATDELVYPDGCCEGICPPSHADATQTADERGKLIAETKALTFEDFTKDALGSYRLHNRLVAALESDGQEEQ